jgi:hypothetical protein
MEMIETRHISDFRVVWNLEYLNRLYQLSTSNLKVVCHLSMMGKSLGQCIRWVLKSFGFWSISDFKVLE